LQFTVIELDGGVLEGLERAGGGLYVGQVAEVMLHRSLLLAQLYASVEVRSAFVHY
jgi:hypothetical protein